MTNAQPGWYPDPSGDVTKLRYFDGHLWTNDYTANPQVQGQVPVQQTTVTTTYTSNGSCTEGQIYPMTDTDRTLRLIAFVLNVVSTVACAILIIPLAWMIPMTVISWGVDKGKKANTVAFGVCTLLFMGIISGILLLCSKKDR